MNKDKLITISEKIMANGRGILAADESTGTIKKRFDQIGVVSTEASRNGYREMLFRAPDFGESISGVILYDEQFRGLAKNGTPLRELIAQQDAVPGIKVDKGAKNLAGKPGEQITEGLDGLRERFAEYADLGAGFAKWRAVINIQGHIPSLGAIRANAEALARYAALSQEAGIVPIVEPEVIMDGSHDIDRCDEVTSASLKSLYEALFDAGVFLEGTLLKPNMVISGTDAPVRANAEEVADRTVACLKRHVPSAVPGVVFLSGGQTEREATEHLHLMNQRHDCPWPLSFSYGRALQKEALQVWQGKPENEGAAQEAFIHRAKMNRLAALGQWSSGYER